MMTRTHEYGNPYTPDMVDLYPDGYAPPADTCDDTPDTSEDQVDTDSAHTDSDIDPDDRSTTGSTSTGNPMVYPMATTPSQAMKNMAFFSLARAMDKPPKKKTNAD